MTTDDVAAALAFVREGRCEVKKPLEKCINGCDAPVQRPSWVLCIRCLAGLDQKIQKLEEGAK